jgi:uncharacterized protein YccT (UPF0319 family)
MPIKSVQIILSLTLLLGLNAGSVYAESVLTFAEAFNIKAVNGKPFASGLLKQEKSVKLNAGINLIAIEYEEVFDSEDTDNFDIIRSGAFLLRIYLQPNTAYVQRIVRPINADAARQYRLNPVFEIVTADTATKPINFNLSALASNEQSFLIAKTKSKQSNKQLLLTDLNSGQLVKGKSRSLFSQYDKQQTQPKFEAKQNLLEQPKNSLEQLRYWWSKASAEDKKKFIKEIKLSD